MRYCTYSLHTATSIPPAASWLLSQLAPEPRRSNRRRKKVSIKLTFGRIFFPFFFASISSPALASDIYCCLLIILSIVCDINFVTSVRRFKRFLHALRTLHRSSRFNRSHSNQSNVFAHCVAEFSWLLRCSEPIVIRRGAQCTRRRPTHLLTQ